MNESREQQLAEELEELQSRYAFQEDLLQALNQTVAEQQRQLDNLSQQWLQLQGSLQQLMAHVEQGQSDEPPPHY